MSEQQPEQTAGPDGSRVVVQYVGPEGADPQSTEEVSLPGYLGALPSVLKPGDLFTVPAEHADELDAQDEFEVGDKIPADHPEFAEAVRTIAGDAQVEPAVPIDLARADAAKAKAAEGAPAAPQAPVAAPRTPPAPPTAPPTGQGNPENPGGKPGEES